jgi:hypothetical protein
MKRKILWACLSLFVLFIAGRIYYRVTDDFRIGNVTHDFKDGAEWDSPSLSAQELATLSSIFDQKFSYLGKGAQCYAFASEDGSYVLKLFKFKHLRPALWVTMLPDIPLFNEYKQKERNRKAAKLHSVLSGYHLAYQHHKEGSGLLYLHFNPTNYLKKKMTVIDKIDLQYHLDLDQTVFLLQKKGETFRARLGSLIKKGNIEGAKSSIGKIMDMYIHEYKQGMWDRDHGVMHNTGFVKDEPFHLDIGKFSRDDKIRDPAVFREDFRHIGWKIDTWIKTHYPEEYPALSDYIEERYQLYTGEPLDVAYIDPTPYLKNKKVNWFLF